MNQQEIIDTLAKLDERLVKLSASPWHGTSDDPRTGYAPFPGSRDVREEITEVLLEIRAIVNALKSNMPEAESWLAGSPPDKVEPYELGESKIIFERFLKN